MVVVGCGTSRGARAGSRGARARIRSASASNPVFQLEVTPCFVVCPIFFWCQKWSVLPFWGIGVARVISGPRFDLVLDLVRKRVVFLFLTGLLADDFEIGCAMQICDENLI